jgi:hypothetical protein
LSYRSAGPYQHLAVFICSEAFSVDEFCREIREIVVFQVEPSL